jgi:hypothetical protein
MSKYTPLQNYLAGLPAGTHSKTMTFVQIEKVINDSLPPSAYKYRPWWANEVEGTHVHARSWLNAGWKVDTVSFSSQWVRFEKVD